MASTIRSASVSGGTDRAVLPKLTTHPPDQIGHTWSSDRIMPMTRVKSWSGAMAPRAAAPTVMHTTAEVLAVTTSALGRP